MNIIYMLIPIAIILVLIAIVVFFWAVKSNQFEDLERQGYSILFDDDLNNQTTTESESQPEQEPQSETDENLESQNRKTTNSE